jgi:hypothetical protein
VLCPARRDSQPCFLLSGEAVRKLEKRKAVEEVRWCSIVPSPIGHFSSTTIAGALRTQADAEGRMSIFLDKPVLHGQGRGSTVIEFSLDEGGEG